MQAIWSLFCIFVLFSFYQSHKKKKKGLDALKDAPPLNSLVLNMQQPNYLVLLYTHKFKTFE